MPILKVILLLGTLFIISNASEIKKDLISKAYISKAQDAYKESKSFDLGNEFFKDFSVKLNVNKHILKNETLYLKIYCNVKDLKESNVSYDSLLDAIIIKIDQNTPNSLYFKFFYEREQSLNFRIRLFNEFEYEYVLLYQEVIRGIAYGIIFSAFLYNLVIFFNTFRRAFLYYSLMQISLFVVLYEFSKFQTMTYISVENGIFVDVFENICLLMTILFSKEILNTKKYLPFINRLLDIIVLLNIFDTLLILVMEESILYTYLPRSFLVFLLIVSAVIVVFKGQKSALFYLLGWSVLFVSLLMIEYRLIEVSELLIMHIGFPLESLILSFALGYKLKQSVQENSEKEQLLVHQSKLASMGEMINNIAHQWRQPLTHLSFINMDLQMAKVNKELDDNYLNEKIEESNDQIEFMSQTIDNFKDFYQPVKEKELFFVSAAVQKAIDIILPSLEHSKILLDFTVKNDKEIKAYENEYSQIVLNFLTNAKDALLERNVTNPQIKVTLDVRNNRSILLVLDNAQGIKEELMHKIFDPYFTTKNKSSGIGLYMSKVIVESHLNGIIRVFNEKQGVCFEVEI